MTKQESIKIVKQFKSMLNYTNLYEVVDGNAETENFGLGFDFTNVVFYLPSNEYPTWQLSFDDRGITTNIEEFDTFTEAVDYLIEQVEMECV
mgnify:FL=1